MPKITMSLDDLELGDIELFEEATGGDLMEALETHPVIDPETGRPKPDPDDPKGHPLMEVKMTGRTLLGLVYIARRHEDPTVTFEDVKHIKLRDFDIDIAEAVEEQPDPPESEPDANEPSEGANG